MCKNAVESVDGTLAVLHGVPNTLHPPGVWLSRLSDSSGAPGGEERCLYAHLCCCLAAGEVAARTPGNPPEARYLDCCCGGILGCAACTYCCCWGVTRTRLRHAYNIPGSSCADHILVTIFPTCYITQALNHLDLAEGKHPGPRAAGLPAPLPVAVPVQVIMVR